MSAERRATHRARDLVAVTSVFGGGLNMLWFVDAIELAFRERSLGPLRMWFQFKRRLGASMRLLIGACLAVVWLTGVAAGLLLKGVWP